MDPVETLDEWNISRRRQWAQANEMIMIKCPKEDCFGQMNDMDLFILESMPPQKRVKCSMCGHEGLRVV